MLSQGQPTYCAGRLRLQILRIPCDVNAAEPPPSRLQRCSYSSEIQPDFLTRVLTSSLIGRLEVSSRFALMPLPTLRSVSTGVAVVSSQHLQQFEAHGAIIVTAVDLERASARSQQLRLAGQTL